MKYFISHSYEDADERDLLIKSLPADIDAFVFPPITTSPDKLVSTELVSAILDCDGLVYMETNSSLNSFWVAFERDFALRAGKSVYRAEKGKGALLEHLEPPLDLATFASYHRDDDESVATICKHLRNERHFDMYIDKEMPPGSDWAEEIEAGINHRIQRGGYVVVFWSESARDSGYVENELASASRGAGGTANRALFALLDETPLPDWWSSETDLVVQLYGDGERPTENRIDDLVVRLYWLIYRNSGNNNTAHGLST